MKNSTLIQMKQVLVVLTTTILLFGCGFNDSAQESSTSSSVDPIVNFSYRLSMSHSNQEDVGFVRSLGSAYVGELLVENLNTKEIVSHPWYVVIDETTFSVLSQKVLTLSPGFYAISLSIEKNGRQYLGQGSYLIEDDIQANINMELNPLVGSVSASASEIEEVPMLKFQYEVSELSGLLNPMIGVSLNDDNSYYFNIDPKSDLSSVFRQRWLMKLAILII